MLRIPLSLICGRTQCLSGFVIFVMLSPGFAQVRKPTQLQTAEPQARRLTIVRVGYGYAAPDQAKIRLPFKVEASTFVEAENLRDDVLKSLAELLKPFDPTGNAVFVSDSTSGQVMRDGRQYITFTGSIGITVRKLNKLHEILAQLKTKSEGTLQVEFTVSKSSVYHSAGEMAQVYAINEARRSANLLAVTAGTKVVGVWELNEGEVKGLDATQADPTALEANFIPKLIPIMSARVTVVFELAPGMTPGPNKVTKKTLEVR